MEVEPQQLETALDRLVDSILGSRVSGTHFIPDLVLLGFARDVLVNGKATLLLWHSEVPGACYPSARAAFEATQDAVFLGTRDDKYDYWGARARASELLDWESAISLAKETDFGEHVPPFRTTQEQLEKDIDIWNHYSPGKGAILTRAMDDVRTDRKKHRFHWSGLSRSVLPSEIVSKGEGSEDVAAMLRSWYNLLSLYSHPSPRIERRNLKVEEGGFGLLVSADPEEIAGPALGAAFVGVVTVEGVLQTRIARTEP